MNVHQIYAGSNGDETTALYKRLEAIGPVGVIALNLFRAQKCSARAKLYHGSHKGEAYRRKEWSLGNLCRALESHAKSLSIVWGWKIDPEAEFHKWVLYVELPTGQVSFHAAARLSQTDFPGDWDHAKDASPGRIIRHVTTVLNAELSREGGETKL